MSADKRRSELDEYLKSIVPPNSPISDEGHWAEFSYGELLRLWTKAYELGEND